MENDTLLRINEISGRINTHPEYSCCVSEELCTVMRDEATKHSIELELRSIRNGKKSFKPRGSADEEFIRQIHAQQEDTIQVCWKELGKYGLDLYSLSTLGHLVEPTKNPYKNFRTTEVSFGPFEGSMPNQIPNHVDNLLWKLSNNPMHPVTRAAEAHLGIIQIHPYADGNGRIARLVQNFCLGEKALPPAIIPAADRELYLHILGESLTDRITSRSQTYKPSTADKRFHAFIASKVLYSLEQLEHNLQIRRAYDIELTNFKELEVVYFVANSVRSFARSGRSQGVQAIIDRSNNNHRGSKIRVIGDIGTDELSNILGHTSQKRAFRYKVQPLVGCSDSLDYKK